MDTFPLLVESSLSKMDEEQRLTFQSEYDGRKKNKGAMIACPMIPKSMLPGPTRPTAYSKKLAVRMFDKLIIFALLLPCFAEAQSLFQPAEENLSSERHLRLQSDPLVVLDHWRLARIDRNEISRALNFDMPLVLNLFNDVELRAHIERNREVEGGSSFLSGSLEDGGHWTLFLHESGVVRGEIHSAQGFYQIKSEGEDFSQVLIKEEDLSRLPGCGNEALSPTGGPSHFRSSEPFSSTSAPYSLPPAHFAVRPSMKAGAARTVEESPVIDVLVLYTQSAEDYEGGAAQTRATIENEMAEMNYVLENSGLSHRKVRLAGIKKVNYRQVGFIPYDYFNLVYTAEDNKDEEDYSALDEVYPLMEKHKADLVHLFVRDYNKLCGFASQGFYDRLEKEKCADAEDYDLCLYERRRKRWKNSVFSVSAITCAGGGYAFTHELGHNLGLLHNRSSYDWVPGFMQWGGAFTAYGFGYIDASDKFCHKTVMGMVRTCPPKSILARYEPYFSNADLFFPRPTDSPHYNPLTYKDIPMGVPGEERTNDLDGPVNAARAIDEAWEIVAGVSDVPPEVVPACKGGDISGDPLSSLPSLPDRVELSSGGETLKFDISFAAPDNCLNVTPVVRHSSHSAFLVTSVEKLGRGSYELSVTAEPHNGSCHSRTSELRVDLIETPGGYLGMAIPAFIPFEQKSHSAFCKSIPDYPADATSLNLSGKNLFPLGLPGNMFSTFALLESLNLSNNRLADLHDSTFAGLNRLKILDLRSNELRKIEAPDFSHLPNLRQLNLGANQIDAVAPAALDLNTRLTHLRLNSNRLTTLPTGLFANLTNLTLLNLSNNRLLEFPDVSKNTKLRQLHLGVNRISFVARGALDENTTLTHLWLNSNRLFDLPPGLLSPLERLTHLRLNSNQLSALPEDFLSDSANLTLLNLSNNRLAEFPDLSKNTKLRQLHLGANRMVSVPPAALDQSPKLTHLWLNSNQLSTLPSDLFSDLEHLVLLHLAKNKLEELPDLSNNTKLANLWLYSNELTTLPDNAFSELSKLRGLWLQSNRISSISAKAFAGLSSLTYLNLSRNPLEKPLPAPVCDFIRSVKKVDMKGIDMKVICP